MSDKENRVTELLLELGFEKYADQSRLNHLLPKVRELGKPIFVIGAGVVPMTMVIDMEGQAWVSDEALDMSIHGFMNALDLITGEFSAPSGKLH